MDENKKKTLDALVEEITRKRAPGYNARVNDYTAVLDVLNGPQTVRARAIDRFRPGITGKALYSFASYAPAVCPLYVAPKPGMPLDRFAAYVAAGVWEPLVADVYGDAAAAFASYRIRFNYPDAQGADDWREWADSAGLDSFAHQVLLSLLGFGRALGQITAAGGSGRSRLVSVDGVDLTNWEILPAAGGPQVRSVTWRKRVDGQANYGDTTGLYAGCRVGGNEDDAAEYWWTRLSLDGGGVQLKKVDGKWEQVEIPMVDPSGGRRAVDRLLVEVFDLRAADNPARPPLADAAWQNLALFGLACERQMLRDTCAPLAAVSGSKPSEIGATNAIWAFADANARLQGLDPGTGTLEDVAEQEAVLRANITAQLSDLRQYGNASGVALSIEAFQKMARARAIAACAVRGLNRLLELVAEVEGLSPDARPVAEMPLGMDAPSGFSSSTTLGDLREAVKDGQLPASVVVAFMRATEQLPAEELELSAALATYRQASVLAADGVLAKWELRKLGLATLGEAGKMFPLLMTDQDDADPLSRIQIKDGGQIDMKAAGALFGASARSTTLSGKIKKRALELVREAGGAEPKWVKESRNKDVLVAVTVGQVLPEIAFYRPGRVSKGAKQEGRRFVGLAIVQPGAEVDEDEQVENQSEEQSNG